MGLKSFDEGRIKSAEIMQLHILYNLYSRKESRNIIFQGGTALRWFHGNNRFSEDLDFVTSIDLETFSLFLNSLERNVSNAINAQFGPGTVILRQRTRQRENSLVAFVDYLGERDRKKATVKLEFEKLKAGINFPRNEQIVLSSAPAVSYFIRTGMLMVPSGRVINVETISEIFSDKVRALMERMYIKGRDFYDVWFLTHTLKAAPDIELVQKKLEMYEHPFVPVRQPKYFIDLVENLDGNETEKVILEIGKDLSRFISPEVMEALQKDRFEHILTSVADTFRTLIRDGLNVSCDRGPNDNMGMSR